MESLLPPRSRRTEAWGYRAGSAEPTRAPLGADVLAMHASTEQETKATSARRTPHVCATTDGAQGNFWQADQTVLAIVRSVLSAL